MIQLFMRMLVIAIVVSGFAQSLFNVKHIDSIPFHQMFFEYIIGLLSVCLKHLKDH